MIEIYKNKMQKTLITFSTKVLILLFMVMNANVYSQENNSSIEMADVMRSNGKIYVVVGVILIIFLGITAYLFSLNKKIQKLEEKLKK
jgi:CcmD family protein